MGHKTVTFLFSLLLVSPASAQTFGRTRPVPVTAAATVVGGCSGGDFVKDSFTRANGNLVGSTPSDCGGTWTQNSGTSGGASVTSNKAADNGNNNLVYANTSPSDADYSAQGVVRAVNTNVDVSGPMVRVAGASDTGSFPYWVNAAGDWRGFDRVLGVETQVCAGGTTDPFAGDVTVKTAASGTTLTITLNGGAACNGTTAIVGAGFPGIYWTSDTGNTLDDFVATN